MTGFYSFAHSLRRSWRILTGQPGNRPFQSLNSENKVSDDAGAVAFFLGSTSECVDRVLRNIYPSICSKAPGNQEAARDMTPDSSMTYAHNRGGLFDGQKFFSALYSSHCFFLLLS
jgi:hypothetical protein